MCEADVRIGVTSPPLSVCVSVCCRSVGYGGPHDVHHSLPAHRQSGPRGLETSDMGLQLVIHVSSHTALCTHTHTRRVCVTSDDTMYPYSFI